MYDFDATSVKKLRKDISSVMIQIRKQTPRLSLSPDKVKGSEVWEGNFQGQPIERVIIYLRSSGCFWSMRTAEDGQIDLKAGCLDCEHSVADTTFGKPISAQSYIKQFLGAYEEYDFSKYPVLCLYNEGSIFNNVELPDEARRTILKIIAADPNIKSVILESLPEFITEEILYETREILGDKHLEIGVGLESSNEMIRKICVNKSFSLKRFEQAAKLITEYGTLLSYVLVKPSFLTEREALEDSIKTAKYAFEVGSKVVSLEPLNIGVYAMSGALNRLGMYRVPWLWTVLEVAREVNHLGELRVGGYQFAPKYEHYSNNCDSCTMRVKDAIRGWNATYDPKYLEIENCSCKAEWQDELNKIHPNLIERISNVLPLLERSVQLKH
ncbi:radical SAM protein [Paenibacillus macquariensis]|uniref:Elp3/MiaA/NifB-like radical SAM core domain-containing protein n=1 Tax=Paenibacillus macquariensis TaxID=948756 RepID=A0ABY1K2G7_9BACL|nr:hypothetical protein [Paenibacillus macquariensis]MEC0090188.1 hypothetical protein [Paenibacillus macquariensis]OAB39562.1 hypothetical protein PMSM_00045 [Paenibacillus macquariensis subsp. macquariensis]SIR17012.1 hypothetical protein SAMN05421578_10812 [Paenibacillus macquariensis]